MVRITLYVLCLCCVSTCWAPRDQNLIAPWPHRYTEAVLRIIAYHENRKLAQSLSSLTPAEIRTMIFECAPHIFDHAFTHDNTEAATLLARSMQWDELPFPVQERLIHRVIDTKRHNQLMRLQDICANVTWNAQRQCKPTPLDRIITQHDRQALIMCLREHIRKNKIVPPPIYYQGIVTAVKHDTHALNLLVLYGADPIALSLYHIATPPIYHAIYYKNTRALDMLLRNSRPMYRYVALTRRHPFPSRSDPSRTPLEYAQAWGMQEAYTICKRYQRRV